MSALMPNGTYSIKELNEAYHRQLGLKDGYTFTILHKSSGHAVANGTTATYRVIRLTDRKTVADVRRRFEAAFKKEDYSCRIASHNHEPAGNTLIANLENR